MINRCIDCDQYQKERYWNGNAEYKLLCAVGSCKLTQKNFNIADPFNEIPYWCPKAMKAGSDIGEPVEEIKLGKGSKGQITETMDPISGYTLKFMTEMEEKEDEFIFTHLQQYCEGMSAYTGITRVPKRLLLRALTCFKEEHAEEYKVLMGVEKEDGNDD